MKPYDARSVLRIQKQTQKERGAAQPSFSKSPCHQDNPTPTLYIFLEPPIVRIDFASFASFMAACAASTAPSLAASKPAAAAAAIASY